MTWRNNMNRRGAISLMMGSAALVAGRGAMANTSNGGGNGMPDKSGLAPNKSLDAALAAIVNSPAQPLASLSVLAVKAGKTVYH